jgi:hypothetical protein
MSASSGMGNREIGCSLMAATYCATAILGGLEDCGISTYSVALTATSIGNEIRSARCRRKSD